MAKSFIADGKLYLIVEVGPEELEGLQLGANDVLAAPAASPHNDHGAHHDHFHGGDHDHDHPGGHMHVHPR